MGDCSDILYDQIYDLGAGKNEKDKLRTSWHYVLEDIAKREEMGYNKYGKYLTVNTDEDMLNHLYNELLDAVVYIRTLINQRANEYDPSL